MAERQRIETSVENLANSRTTRTPEGGPYRRRDVVFEAVPMGESFTGELSQALELRGVVVSSVEVDDGPPMLAHDPGHPDADENGMVRLPNIDSVEELVNLVAAARSYEANLTAADISRRLVERAIDLGRG